VTFTYRISDGGTVSRQSGGASGRCTPRTLRSSTGSFANANNAVKVSEAFLEITDNCEARLRFQAVTLLQNTKYVGNGGPVLFVNLMANGASLTETGGQMDVKIDACNTPEEKATTLRDSGLTPDRLNAATTFSLRMSGASGTRCP